MIKINAHSSICIDGFYFDPFMLTEEPHDAKAIFFTHDHFDHFSKQDVEKVANEDTLYICPKSCLENIVNAGIDPSKIKAYGPDEKGEVLGVSFETIHSYNVGKINHKPEYDWLGYVAKIGEIRYYIPGDMDENPDALAVKCDVAFVPIGGTYTMNASEAASFINKLRPKEAIPMHYGSAVGPDVKGEDFAKLVDKEIKTTIYIK